MPKLIAMYKRDAGLNVRKEPRAGAEIVRTMQNGDQAECFGVFGGWAKLADGYANASFLDVALCEVSGATPSVATTAPEADSADDREDADELQRMTNAQLYDLAEQSGVKVAKGATKEELIAAILADE